MDRATADARGYARVGFFFLTANCAAAVHRWAQDAGSVVFVVGSYGTLLLLFRCLRDFERAHPGAEDRRGWLRRKIWCLCTLLTVMFAWKVASVVPWPFTVAVWALGADAAIAGFFAFFVHRAREYGYHAA